MRIRPRVSLPLAVTFGLVASLTLAGVALAAEVTLTADLAGVTEGDSPGDPDGTGTASIVIDPEAGTACWDLTAEGIEPVTQSHIHVGAEGVSGDVVVPLDVDGFEGTSEGCTEPMEDAAILQEIVDDPAGYYVNLHTEDFPAGAIRGNLAAGSAPNTAMPVPGADGSVGLLGALLAAIALGIGLRAWRPLATRD
jgi:CHRD domain-containing protein